jgi:hypothetical protein
MVKVSEFEAVPPGLMTVTLAVPAVAIRLADTDAVNWVVPTYEVVSELPFQRMADPETKPVPLTVNVKVELPAMAELGFRLLIASPTGGLMVKAMVLDTVPPGFITVMLALPALAIRLAGTEPVSCVAPTYVVATSWRKNDRLNPSPSIRGAAHFCEVVRIDAPKHF